MSVMSNINREALNRVRISSRLIIFLFFGFFHVFFFIFTSFKQLEYEKRCGLLV